MRQSENREKPSPVHKQGLCKCTPEAIQKSVHEGIETDLSESQKRYQALVENISDFIWEVDANGVYTYCSPQIKELWGYSPEAMLGKTPFEFVIPEDKDRAVKVFFSTKESRNSYRRMETSSFDSAGRIIVVETSAVPFFDDDGRLLGYRGISRDVTEKRRAEKALKESEEKYRLLVENADEAVMVFQERMVKFFNSKAMDISGYSSKELSSRAFDELIHPDDRSMVVGRYLKRLKGEGVQSSYQFRMIRKDGKIRWLSINAVLITWEDKPAVLALLNDITGRKKSEEALVRAKAELEQANEQLKQYGHRITQVQEEERKRIAYELHDDTAQYLAILKLQLDSLIHSGKIQDAEILKKLQYLEEDASRAADDVRRYSHELRPGVLEHLGLHAALEQIAWDINKLKQISVDVVVDGEEQKLPEHVKLGFFRIAQEALNNARKHSQATRSIISLKFTKAGIQMVVSDDGTGFNVRKAKVRTGLKGNLGLMSMHERAKLIGASLKIESKQGKGTVVAVDMPQ